MRGISLSMEYSRWTGTPSPGALRTMLRIAECASTSPRKRGEVKTAPPFHLSPLAGRGRIALAIRVRGSLSKRGRDGFKHTRHIAQHFVVPKSQDSVVEISKPFVTNEIARVVRVPPSIYLNNQTTYAADKVDRVRTDRFLTNKFMALETARSQPVPKCFLGFGCGAPQASGALSFDLISSSQADTPPHPDCFAIRPLPAGGERLAHRAIQ
jgi:hypothetical protein